MKKGDMKNMENTTTKKLAGGLILALLLGVVIVTADNTGDEADDTEERHMPFIGRGMFSPDLTDEQHAELEELITSLSNEGATPDEMREAVDQLLDEWGILDERLDNAIEQTHTHLAMLERADELRDQGYSWDEINEIIQEEFDVAYPIYFGQGMMFGHGHGHHHPGGLFDSEKDLDTDTESDVETTSV